MLTATNGPSARGLRRWAARANKLANVVFELDHGQRAQAEPVGAGLNRAPAELFVSAPGQEDDWDVQEVLTGSHTSQDVEPVSF